MQQAAGLHLHLTRRHSQLSQLRNLLPVFPCVETGGLIFTHEQKKSGSRVLISEFAQAVYRVTRSVSQQLALINQNLGQVSEIQRGHGRAMSGVAKSAGFVPGVAGGQHMQHIKLQLTDGASSQRMMACVRRIKSAAIQTYALLA